jgi:predicted nucleic acid-binding protein
MGYLVDTSAWIDYLRGTDDPHVRRLNALLEPPSAVVLTPVVFQEVLQGARDDATFRTYRTFFGSQRFVFPSDPIRSYVDAARIYQRCRLAGITIRSTIDCLIAQIAIMVFVTGFCHT